MKTRCVGNTIIGKSKIRVKVKITKKDGRPSPKGRFQIKIAGYGLHGRDETNRAIEEVQLKPYKQIDNRDAPSFYYITSKGVV